MKLVCINNSPIVAQTCNLTVGKVYSALNEPFHWKGVGVKIQNDNGEYFFYDVSRFETLQDVRYQKLKDIGV